MKNLFQSGFLTAFFFILVVSTLSAQTDPISQDPTTVEAETTLNSENLLDESQLLFNNGASGDNLLPGNQGSSVRLFIQPILALIFVIALIYGVIYLLKRTSGQKNQTSNIISILSTQTLTNQNSLHIVEIQSKLFLIGSGNSITLLKEFDDQEFIDTLKLELSATTEHQKSFAELINEKLQGRGVEFKKPNVRKSIDEQKERLRKLSEREEPQDEDIITNAQEHAVQDEQKE